MRLFFKISSTSGQDTRWHPSQMYITVPLDLCGSERERTGPDRIQRMDRQERTIFGARHNTVSLLCQTGLDRRTDDIGLGNVVFRARNSMLPRDRVYRDRYPRDPRAIRAAFTAASVPLSYGQR